MTTHADSATAELTVGARMEPEFELTDDQWNLISDLFADPPPSPEGGRPRASSRACFEAIVWVLRSGARWKDLPKYFPSHPTCWRRLKQWSEAGVFQKAWSRLVNKLDNRGEVDRDESFADGTFCSAKKGAFV